MRGVASDGNTENFGGGRSDGLENIGLSLCMTAVAFKLSVRGKA